MFASKRSALPKTRTLAQKAAPKPAINAPARVSGGAGDAAATTTSPVAG